VNNLPLNRLGTGQQAGGKGFQLTSMACASHVISESQLIEFLAPLAAAVGSICLDAVCGYPQTQLDAGTAVMNC
jgi:hypothetical protein